MGRMFGDQGLRFRSQGQQFGLAGDPCCCGSGSGSGGPPGLCGCCPGGIGPKSMLVTYNPPPFDNNCLKIPMCIDIGQGQQWIVFDPGQLAGSYELQGESGCGFVGRSNDGVSGVPFATVKKFCPSSDTCRDDFPCLNNVRFQSFNITVIRTIDEMWMGSIDLEMNPISRIPFIMLFGLGGTRGDCASSATISNTTSVGSCSPSRYTYHGGGALGSCVQNDGSPQYPAILTGGSLVITPQY